MDLQPYSIIIQTCGAIYVPIPFVTPMSYAAGYVSSQVLVQEVPGSGSQQHPAPSAHLEGPGAAHPFHTYLSRGLYDNIPVAVIF